MSVRPIRPPALALALFGVASSLVPLPAQDRLGETGMRGAGSTFVYPVLSRWSRDYRTFLARGGDLPTGDEGLNDPPASSALEYEPVGSLAGALRVKDRAVDFGASEMPLKSAELSALGLAQFPLVMGGVVAAVNIDGIAPGALKLTGPLLAGIFLGRITHWSDPAIRAVNPGVPLPSRPIAVIHRGDGSGTTFAFTDYLSKVSAEWNQAAGSGLLVKWPVGTAAKGNEGVARAVAQTHDSIGYVDYAMARQMTLSDVLLQNQAGNFVRAEPAGFQAAALEAGWERADDFYVLLTNQPGVRAYPVTATVFVVMPRGASRRSAAALDFFQWSFDRGADTASRLGYVPLPRALVEQVRRYWTNAFKR